MITGHAFIATSLDGFIAREDGGIDWLLSRDDPDEDHGYRDFIRDIDGIVMGRGSFETVSRMDQWPYDRPVVVLSRSLAATDVPPALAGRVRCSALSPAAVMESLAREGWRRAYVDGGQVLQSFLREGLIADIVITQVPVLIGAGRRLFGATGADIALTHLGTRTFPSGLVQSRYRIGA